MKTVSSMIFEATRPLKRPVEDIISQIVKEYKSHGDFATYPLQLQFMLRMLWLIHQIPGDIAEMGVYKGRTSLAIQRFLKETGSEKKLHVYDSFTGLPKPTFLDPWLQEGEYKFSVADFRELFNKNNIELPVIHEGWFKDIPAADHPSRVSFAFFDSDFYESILDSFAIQYPRLTGGGIVVIHDWGRPGVEMAGREYLGEIANRIVFVEGLGVLWKRNN